MVTYGELIALTDKMSAGIADRGLEPGARIAVCIERSVDLVAGLLSVLRCGGSFVPLEPTLPEDRLSYIISDADVTAVLTQKSLRHLFAGANVPQVFVEELAERVNGEPRLDNMVAGSPTSAAYLIYTSGSTGNPKGVEIRHESIINQIRWRKHAFGISPEDRVLQSFSLAFDPSIWEIFGALEAGACLVISKESSNPEYIADLIAKSQITTLQVVPSMLKLLLQLGTFRTVDGLRHVICGGEQLFRETVLDFYSQSDAKLHNLYGPTEATIDATWWTCDPEDTEECVPIGRPISNADVVLLDSQGRPVPVGVPGEIYISGIGVGNGYVGKPELTAKAFVSVGQHVSGETRAYRTGDIGIYREDGAIEFRGRKDRQLKVRGYRIEPAEIEKILMSHPAVRGAAVAGKLDAKGTKHLVAYFDFEGDEAPGDRDLRDLLSQALPVYMVPTLIIAMDELPRGPSNKVDFSALPDPEWNRGDGSDTPAEESEIERELYAIWLELLQVEAIDRDANFFELGGDSLSLAMCIGRIEADFGQRIETGEFFTKSFRDLARALETSSKVTRADDEAKGGLVAMEDSGGADTVLGPVPLTPSQHRFLNRGSADPHHWNISAALASERLLVPDLLERALAEVLSHHDALRLRFERGSQGWTQRNDGPRSDVPFRSLDLSQLELTAARATIDEIRSDLQGSFDIADGPIFQLVHFHLGNGQQDQLLMIVHHLVADHYSIRLILDDFQTAYEQLLAEAPVRLPSKTTSFQEWARTLAELPELPQSKEFVLEQLKMPWQEVAPLPRSLPGERGDNTNASARVVSIALTADESDTLLNDARYQPQEFLLSALYSALAAWTGSSSQLIDVMVHGRDPIGRNVDVSRTVGMFVSYLPVVLRANSEDPEPQLDELARQIRRVRDNSCSLDVVRYSASDSELAAEVRNLPTSEVLLNYRGAPFHLARGAFLKMLSVGHATDHTPSGLRDHPLSIAVDAKDSGLSANFVYCNRIHKESEIRSLASMFHKRLGELSLARKRQAK